MTPEQKADLKGDIIRGEQSDSDRDAAAGIRRRPFTIMQDPVRMPPARHGEHCTCRECFLAQRP